MLLIYDKLFHLCKTYLVIREKQIQFYEKCNKITN